MINKEIALYYTYTALRYLVKQITTGGKFIYQRTKDGNIIPNKYNILRHSGCVWAISSAQRVIEENFNQHRIQFSMLFQYIVWGNFNQQYVEEPLKAAINYLSGKQVTVKRGYNNYLLVTQNSFGKLGANALTTLALKSMGHSAHQISLGMDFFFEDVFSGKIRGYKYDTINRKFTDFKSEYYGGEACLALCSVGNYSLAFAVFKEIVEVYDQSGKILHDHWLLQAIEALYYSPYCQFNEIRKVYLKHWAHQIAKTIFTEKEQYLERSTPIACRIEGLISFYNISKTEWVFDYIGELIERLEKFRQHDPEHPCYGAFIDKEVYRIDYTQHALMAFLRYYQICNV